MALRVASLCGYLCSGDVVWRRGAGGDFDAHDWIQALKGKSFKGYAQVPVCGTTRRLSDENASDAIQWFGEMAAAYLSAKKIAGPLVIIPVPNSSSVINSTVKPRTRKLAKALAERLGKDGTVVLDCLRWKEDWGPASKGAGSRDAAKLCENLAVLREHISAFVNEVEDPETYTVVLVDDVTTSGGHLQACAAKLKKAGVVVDSVICGGRTIYDQKYKPFDVREEKLDEYEP